MNNYRKPVCIAPRNGLPKIKTPYDFAREELTRGVVEIPGSTDNSRILEYLSTVGLGHEHDETPWCSAFVNWCVIQAGLVGTNSGMARSWLRIGDHIHIYDVEEGDIVIFWRDTPGSTNGHVGFLVDFAPSSRAQLLILGGNQGNAVSEKFYPYERLLGVRRLVA